MITRLALDTKTIGNGQDNRRKNLRQDNRIHRIQKDPVILSEVFL